MKLKIPIWSLPFAAYLVPPVALVVGLFIINLLHDYAVWLIDMNSNGAWGIATVTVLAATVASFAVYAVRKGWIQ